MSAVADKSASPPEEQSTKFRPSENFKHVKKYLKWKFENSSPDASNDSPQSTSTSSPGDEEQVQTLTEVQPPLPPYSPPPGVYIKKEIKTIDYEDREPDPSLDNSQPESIFNTSVAEPKEIMCRNFVRGTCKNEYTCKFAHKIILDQLRMVYKFCKEFQNKGCSLQDCRYVHCTVFEQEEFYRTGQLPPQATEHIKQYQPRSQNSMKPEEQHHVSPQHQVMPPQPIVNMAYETSPTIVPVGGSSSYMNGTDSLHYGQSAYQYEQACATSNQSWTFDNQFHESPQHQIMPQQPTMNTSFETCATLVPANGSPQYTNGTDPHHHAQSVYQYELACSTSGNERPWTSDTAYSQRDLDFRDLLLKKCEDCDKNEFRHEYYKNKTLEMITETVEREQNLKQIDQKYQRLINILKCISQPGDLLNNQK